MRGRGHEPSSRRSSRARCRRGARIRHVGKFANDPSLTDAQVATIAAWADGGAPEGNRVDLPKAPTFTEGWAMGKPDLIFEMVEPFEIPADGTVPYTYVTIPTHLDHDIWIRGLEYKTTDRRVLHHIIGDLVEGSGGPTSEAEHSPAIGRARRSAASAAMCRDVSTTCSTKASRRRFLPAPTSCCRCTTRRLARRSATDCRSA